MKKILIALALIAGLSVVPTVAVHADPIDDIPTCYLQVNPNAPLIVPVSFGCEQKTLPGGIVLNAIYINS